MLVGWIFSLCLHEFGHAVTAVLGGDTSPAHFVISASIRSTIPTFCQHHHAGHFHFDRRIGLPGGAVYLRRDLIRNRDWQSAISLAGPFGNFLFSTRVGAALARLAGCSMGILRCRRGCVLAFFQVMAIVLNLMPIPPLDGFGVILPWLPRELAQLAMSVAMYALSCSSCCSGLCRRRVICSLARFSESWAASGLIHTMWLDNLFSWNVDRP